MQMAWEFHSQAGNDLHLRNSYPGLSQSHIMPVMVRNLRMLPWTLTHLKPAVTLESLMTQLTPNPWNPSLWALSTLKLPPGRFTVSELRLCLLLSLVSWAKCVCPGPGTPACTELWGLQFCCHLSESQQHDLCSPVLGFLVGKITLISLLDCIMGSKWNNEQKKPTAQCIVSSQELLASQCYITLYNY